LSAEPDKPAAPGQAAAPGRRVRLWVPALLMALIVGGIWGPNLLRPPPPAWTVYTNVKGVIRRVILADKSVVRLNGASQVRVVYEDHDRRAAMGQAEAAFTIVDSPRRPFLIDSGDRQISMTGGEINILRQTTPSSARTVLTVRQGKAIIYGQDRSQAAVAIGLGQEASWTDGEGEPAVRQVNPANAFAWESHRLAYDHAPLSEVVADLNRYVARPIRIADPSLAALPYTGILTLEGEDMMLRRIAAVLPIEAKPLPAEIVLQKPTPKAKKKTNALVQSLLKLSKPRLAPKPKPAIVLPPPQLLPKPLPKPLPKQSPKSSLPPT
jgi:transmembrane sensor